MSAAKNIERAVRLATVASFTVALSFAFVPLYNLLYHVTGFGGVPDISAQGSDIIQDRMVRLRFDGLPERGMPWVYRPVARELEIRVGETGLAVYVDPEIVHDGSAKNLKSIALSYTFHAAELPKDDVALVNEQAQQLT